MELAGVICIMESSQVGAHICPVLYFSSASWVALIWFQILPDGTPLPIGCMQSQLSAAAIALDIQLELLCLQAMFSFAAINSCASKYVLSWPVLCRMIAMAWDSV